MLQTLSFTSAPADQQQLLLGVLSSRNVAEHAVSFSVPAHVFATLNVVVGGSLRWLGHGDGFVSAFSTGAQSRATRYAISPGATLLTLFCRCELLPLLAGSRQDAAMTGCDARLSASALFPAFQMPLPTGNTAEIESSMWAAVSPAHWKHLSLREEQSRHRARRRMDACLRELLQAPLARVDAARAEGSERQLQRDFAQHWGMPMKLVQRLLRLQRGLQLWHADPQQIPLAELAAAMGLTDQAHLAKEFRELVGEAPSALKDAEAIRDPLWALERGRESLLPLFERSLWLSEISKT